MTEDFEFKVAKKRKITDNFKPRNSPQTEEKQSSEIQSSIDAINNDISDLGKKLSQIQQKQESHLMRECSIIGSRLKFESKELEVSTFCFSSYTRSDAGR